MDVLTFGETMVAFRADRPLAMNPNISATIAGAESNVAIALARLATTSSGSAASVTTPAVS